MTEKLGSSRIASIPGGLIAALAIAFLLGLPHLSSEQLWFDEVLSLSIYRPPVKLAEMTAYLAANENHPPLYYFLMAGWTRLFGASPAVIRLPSVLLTALAVGLLYGVARRWFGQRVATIAALLYALSPIAVEFSREARPYALLAVFALASWWALSRWLDGGAGRRWLAAYIGLTVAGLYTHYAYLFLAGSQLMVALLTLGQSRAAGPAASVRRRQFAVAVGAIALGFAPWLPVLFTNLAAQYLYPDGLEPISRLVLPSNFLILDFAFNSLFFPAKWPVDALGRMMQGFAVGALAAGAGLALTAAWRADRFSANTRPPASAAERADLWPPRFDRLVSVLLWISIPPLLFLFSPIAGRYSWYYHRHLLTVLPAFCLAAALALEALGRLRRPFSPRMATATLGVAVVALFNFPQYLVNDSRWDPQHQFADVARYLAVHEGGGGGRELVVGLWPNYRILLDYYSRGHQTVGSLVPEAVYSNQLRLVKNEPRLTAMEGYLLTHPNIPFRRYRLPDELENFDRIWVVSVTPALFDLDLALAAAGWTPTYVELPEPLHVYLFRFDRLAGVCRPTAGQ